MGSKDTKVKGLLERLSAGEAVVCAEGYLYEFERRGYLRAGCFVPEVVLEHPEMVRGLHEDFVHAGSDVVQAFTYYAHREKLSLIGREDDLERMNRGALRIARDVADRTGTLMAGNICNTNVLTPDSGQEDRDRVAGIFKEQIEWVVEEGADFIVAETFFMVEEALMAVDAIKQHGNGLPMVVTLAAPQLELTADTGESYAAACRRLQDRGAHVVGLNCVRGPKTMMKLLPDIVKACDVPVAALPVPYRCNAVFPTMLCIRDMDTGKRAFPDQLDAHLSSRDEIAWFTRSCRDAGVKYYGLCCGASPAMVRTMAETLGRRPPASKYSPHMDQHFLFGNDHSLKKFNTDVMVKHA